MREIKNFKDFDALVKSGKPLLVDFFANWCGPCRTLLPTVAKLADKYDGQANIVKVDVDVFSELAQQFQVRSIPALFFINEGKIAEALVGVQTEAVLESKIKDYLSVDA